MKYTYVVPIYLALIMISPCIGMDESVKNDDPLASYGGNAGHALFVEERKKSVIAVAASIPAYVQWSVNKNKDLSVCYQKHMGDIGQKRNGIAKQTNTPRAEQYGLPREDPKANEMYYTPTDAPKHHLLKQTSIASFVTLLTSVVNKDTRGASIEDGYTRTTLRILTPDEWPIAVFNEVLQRSDLYKKGHGEFLEDFKKVTFYSIFSKMLDVFWEMGPKKYTKTVADLIEENPLLDFKDMSTEAMEVYRKSLNGRDNSMSLLEMEMTLRDPQEGNIPLTKTYCFVPTFPNKSPNGVTEESLRILKSGIFAPFLEHTSRHRFPKLYRVVGRLWKGSILLETNTLDAVTTALGRFSFVFYNKTPFARGTASIGEIELEGIGLYHQRNKTLPQIVYPLEGLQKLDQVALGSLTFTQYLEHFRKTVTIVNGEKSLSIPIPLTDTSTQQSANTIDEASKGLSSIHLS